MNRKKRKTSELQSFVRWFRLKKIYSRLGIDLKCQPASRIEKMLWKNILVIKRRKLQREGVKFQPGGIIHTKADDCSIEPEMVLYPLKKASK